MNKMGGVICDECRVVIYPKQNDTYTNHVCEKCYLDLKKSIVKELSIEDLKQNGHVQGLLETLKVYGTWEEVFARQRILALDQFGEQYVDIEEDNGDSARAKLKEWE